MIISNWKLCVVRVNVVFIFCAIFKYSDYVKTTWINFLISQQRGKVDSLNNYEHN